MTSDFDIASKHYDNVFTFSKIGKAQRQRVYKNVHDIFRPKKLLSILELNCGTGEDALHMANLGHNILATDISEQMITVANSKKGIKNLKFKVQDINSLDNTSIKHPFDVIFSNFGGLNCLSPQELSSFFSKASKLLNDNAKLILVIMPKHCLWERFYFRLKGERQKSIRRNTNKSVPVNVDGVKVNTWYYNPDDIINLTQNKFRAVKIKPIGLAIPPSYMEASILTKTGVFHILLMLEKLLCFSKFSKYADHFLIELEKQ